MKFLVVTPPSIYQKVTQAIHSIAVHNLSKSWNKWAWLLQVLGREWEYYWTSGLFSVAMVQAVLIYGS